jgi:transposase-like protein
MARALTEDQLSVWKDRIARQASSGLSVTKFCQQEQISEANYYYWRRRLHGSPKRRKAASRHSGRSPERDHGTQFIQLPVPSPRGSAWVEITSADGMLVRLPQQNLAALELTLATLSGARHLAR